MVLSAASIGPSECDDERFGRKWHHELAQLRNGDTTSLSLLEYRHYVIRWRSSGWRMRRSVRRNTAHHLCLCDRWIAVGLIHRNIPPMVLARDVLQRRHP